MVTSTMIFSIKCFINLTDIKYMVMTIIWFYSNLCKYTPTIYVKCQISFILKKKIHSMLAYLIYRFCLCLRLSDSILQIIFTSSFFNDQTIQESYLHGQVNIESYVCLIIFIRRLIVFMYLSGMCITDHIYCIIQDSPVFMCINCICSLSHDKDWAL